MVVAHNSNTCFYMRAPALKFAVNVLPCFGVSEIGLLLPINLSMYVLRNIREFQVLSLHFCILLGKGSMRIALFINLAESKVSNIDVFDTTT